VDFLAEQNLIGFLSVLTVMLHPESARSDIF